MIKSANEMRRLTEGNVHYQKEIADAVSSVQREMQHSAKLGLTHAHFSVSSKYYDEVKQIFLSKGYRFVPTGYIGGVLQRTERITW